MIVYSSKLKNINKENKIRFKVELMKLQVLGKMITGEDINFLDDFEKTDGGGGLSESDLMKAGFTIN